MEEPPTRLPENTFKLTFKISASKSNNGMSFWALLVCVFLYISIFYLFNLSPWVLFNTSQFWFLISNTLILIDSGAFSSSKPNIPDPIDQLTTTPHYNFCAFETSNKYTNGLVQHKEKNETLKTPPKATISSRFTREFCPQEESNTDFQLNRWLPTCELSSQEGTKPTNNTSDHVVEIYEHKEEATDDVKSCQRSKSERVIRVVGGGDEGDKVGLRRSSTEKCDEPENVDEESDQLSGMSDEELNRRVEEFIRRFYNQQLIRPQRG